MVHTRHSFAESLRPKRQDISSHRKAPRDHRNSDGVALLNGTSRDGRPSRKRKAYDDMSVPYHEYVTRNSTRAAKRSSAHYHSKASSSHKLDEDSMVERRRSGNEEISHLAKCFSEPRRSARQRREVYGTLNETLMVKEGVVDKNSNPQGGEEEEQTEDNSMYDYVKQRQGKQKESNAEDDRGEGEESNSQEEEEEEGSEDEEDEEEDQGSQGRPYSFREKRTATRRYSAPPISGKSRKREAFYNVIPHSPMHKKRHHRMPQHSFPDSHRRRKHYGSSTSSSDSDDEHRFERRKAKSMAKARARCLPMNLKPSDVIGVLKDRERARERNVIGTSLADVDPMSIDNKVSFGSVGGLDQHIRSLKEMVVFPLLYPEVFEKFRIAPPRGVLFYGPPGTGKTLVARALANECSSEEHKVSFFMRKGADCLSKWVGESERQLRLLFDQAYSMRPSIIFFDEIDGLAPVRSTRQDQIHSSIVSTLLALMDGLDSRGEVVVIGATNRIDAIDPALRRPGRFDREFLFTLPNRVARRKILEIHTKEWQPKISKAFSDELADQCVGYCGADIKALCTEAALVALRRRYPQIYSTNKKLVLDTSNIKISAKDFHYAMKTIVPASQRSVASPGRALHHIVKPLLESTLETILEKIRAFFPEANVVKETTIDAGNNNSKTQCVGTDMDFSDDDFEDDNEPSIYEPLSYGRSTRTTQRTTSPPPANARFLHFMHSSASKPLSHRARFLMTGEEGMGQSTHFAPAVLHSMEHLKVYVLDLPSLFGVSARVPEEACSQIFTEARRTAPCVIYLPHIDVWWSSINETCKCTFLQLLEDLPASLSIILLSTSNVDFARLPDRVKQMFSAVYGEVFEVRHPTEGERRKFFQELLLTNALQPPLKSKPSKVATTLEVLPVAPAPQKRQLSEQELKNLREQEQNTLRELRLFLRQIVWKLMADRKFKEFVKPVDLEEVSDYLEVIKEPMDLSTIMTKINSHQYQGCAQFLKDVDLITSNCLEYNPDQDTYDRLLRNRVCELRDTAHAMIHADLDPEFEKMCEEIAESRRERNDAEDVFAPSYIRVLQKNPRPLRSSSSQNTNSAEATTVAQSSTDYNASSNDGPSSRPYNDGATRHSRRLRGEESVDIPSFCSPIETIIRSAEKRKRRGRSKSESIHNPGDAIAATVLDCRVEIEGSREMSEALRGENTSKQEQVADELTEEKEPNFSDQNGVDSKFNGDKSEAIPDEEKPSHENSFVVVNKEICENSKVDSNSLETGETSSASQSTKVFADGNMSLRKSVTMAVDCQSSHSITSLSSNEVSQEANEFVDGHEVEVRDNQSIDKTSKQRSSENPRCALSSGDIGVCKDETVSSRGYAANREVVKASKSLDFDSVRNDDEEDDDEDVKIINDGAVYREAIENLLARLVVVTESETVTSLEKIYFNISNCIYRNRRQQDKHIVIKEIGNFIGLLEKHNS